MMATGFQAASSLAPIGGAYTAAESGNGNLIDIYKQEHKMNKTANQLYDQYREKLLWVTLQKGDVKIGQFVGLSGGPESTDQAKGIIIWIVGNLSGFFTDKGKVPLKENFTTHPLEIFDISVLDWNETGGAKQLAELCGRSLVRIRIDRTEQATGVILAPFVPQTAYGPLEEGIYILEMETPETYSRYIVQTGIIAIHAPRLVFLSEIAILEILQKPPGGANKAGT